MWCDVTASASALHSSYDPKIEFIFSMRRDGEMLSLSLTVCVWIYFYIFIVIFTSNEPIESIR